MFSFTNRLRGVGRGTRSRSGTQGNGQWADNQSLESWQIQGMGEAPWDLSVARCTTWLGNTGRYSFGEDAGQQGTEPGFGFALPEFGNQGLNQATASGTAEMGSPDLWASSTTGTGMSGFGIAPLATGNQGVGPTSASGAKASGGPGQWANLTTGTGISNFGFAQLAMGNQCFGQATALGATATGGPVQGASPTTGMGINVAEVQGSVGDP